MFSAVLVLPRLLPGWRARLAGLFSALKAGTARGRPRRVGRAAPPIQLELLEGRLVPAGIHITSVPPYGVGGVIRGQVTGVDFAAYHVAPYIQIEGSGWWTKPTLAYPTVPINADGTFVANVATGGIDDRATIFAAALLPASVTPPLAQAAGRIPAGLAPTAIDFVERYARTIQFAGLTWAVKEAPLPVGPGFNRFSDLPGDVFVDAAGLHLGVTFHDGAWWSTEVILLNRLGYGGTYSFQTSTDQRRLDPNVTFAGFLWDSYGDDSSGADPNREIDFEDSRWGNAADPTNAQVVVQPFGVAGNLHRYTIPDLGTNPGLTRFFRWDTDRVQFTALRGYHTPSDYQAEDVIDQYLYLHDPSVGHFVPTLGRERFRFNVWLNTGGAPSDGAPARVVVKNFTFDPNADTFVVGEFPGQGVWRYSTSRGWRQLASNDASAVAADDAGDVAAMFPGYGVYRYEDAAGWQLLSTARATQVGIAGGGTVAATFPGSGVWRFKDGSGWRRLAPSEASSLAVDASGDVAAAFPASGVWRYEDATGWQLLSSAAATQVSIAGAGVVAGAFSGAGVWRFRDGGGWQQLASVGAASVAVDAAGDVAAAFSGLGVWRFRDGGGWQQLAASDAAQVAIDAYGDVAGAFTRYGVWRYRDGLGWQLLTSADASGIGA
jgi:hypothetical protein